MMKRLVVIVALSMLTITGSMISFSTPALAANKGDVWDVYLKIESFTWKEFNDNGTQLLKESGPIYGLGASARSDISKTMTLKFKGELFGGSIDYDGQTQGGTPVKTDTDYFGFKMEGDAGWKFMAAGKSSLEPFAGLGYRWWIRSIGSRDNAIGYDETWQSFYARLGIRGDLAFSDQLKAFAEAGVKLPIYTQIESDLGILWDTITVEPGNEASVFAEVGLKWTMLKVSVFYEGMRFSKSDAVRESGLIIWQPESRADIYGVNIGVAF